MLYALATIQACVDGNKRVAAILVSTFLTLNGHRLTAEKGALAAVVLEAAEADRAEEDEMIVRLTAWMAENIEAR